MRHIKQLLVLFLVFNVFASCEKEEVSYALQDISAPTDVKAIFDISQDEIGLVTLTPAATGASEFQVYFGDVENETPTMVNPGETINYTYAEGEYSLRIIAVGLTGLTSELVRIVTVSFDAPEDLDVKIEISGTNPFEVLVTPSATNAAVFDLYFGDAEDEEPTTIIAGETESHEYAEIGDYTIRVVARGAGAATLESSEDVTITGAVNAVTLPITFDDATVNYVVNGFGASDFGAIPVEVISNPDALRINTSEKMLSVNKTVDAQVWAGASIALEGPIDFTKGTTITLQVWSPRAGTPILLKIEDSSSPKDDNGNPTIFVEVQVNSTLVNTWEELTFDLSSNSDFSASNSYDTVIVFPDFGSIGKGELFYFDDIKLPAGDGGGNGNGQISDDFDANRNIDTWFGDACGMNDAFPNPFKTGINTSNTVLEYNDDGGQYANVRFDVVPNFDLSVDNTFTLKIYVPSSSVTGTQPNQISLKLQDGTADKPWEGQTEIIKPIVLDQWQTVTFDFANDVTAGAADPLNRTDFNRVVLQVNSEGNNDLVIAYIDDFIYGVDNGVDNGTVDTSPLVGTWNLAPEEKALLVGSTAGDIWWFNNTEDLTTRACLFDDTYVFNSDGSFNNVFGSDTWIEGWQGGSDACGATVTPHDGSVAATYAYNEAAGTVTLNGTGAYLGIPKAYNDGELGDPANAPASITYNVELSDNDNTMNLEILVGGGNVWYFKLVREGSSNDGGGTVTGTQIDLPVDFEGSTVDYTLTDFGDNASSVIVDPTDAGNMVAKVIKTNTAATWAGTTIGTATGFATNIPITLTNSKMTVRVWSPDAGTPIRLKIEDANDVTHTCETETISTVTAGWETIEFDFANQATGTELLSVGLDKGWVYNKASIFFNFGTDGPTAGEKTYYFDDVLFIQ